jgi:hypothetical protein
MQIRRPVGRLQPQRDPFVHLTAGNLLATLTELTAIGDHNGWRQSTTEGEEYALLYMEGRLEKLRFLERVGLEWERQRFRTYTGNHFHRSSVELVSGGSTIEVAADAVPGHRDRLELAIRFDSDGVLNDTDPDPVTVEGPPLVVRSSAEIHALSPTEVEGRIVFLDYSAVDRVVHTINESVEAAWILVDLDPAGIVMVTEYSNQRGLSHGTFSSDLPGFTWVEIDPLPPILIMQIEDVEANGINGWSGLEGIDTARLTWDADILSPADSSLLMARVPGRDSSRAMILGAHIDSSNTPGALDNGSGSTVLIEVAQALDRSRTIPPVDLYFVWFGSHERGMYGSATFATRNSEIIDRSLAMLQMDCLSSPVDGLYDYITFESWPYGRFGDERLTWPDYLEEIADDRGIPTLPWPYYGLVSDNSNFGGVNLPNTNMIFMNPEDIVEVHYDNHMHDPYDTIERAEEQSQTFQQMAEVMLTAALRTADDNPLLRVTPSPDRRALVVGSHTEAVHMSVSSMTEFGMALAWEGFDVDTVGYGDPLTAGELEDADLVVVLPVHDYPSAEGQVSLYDQSWSQSEADVLEDYVQDGGMLVLTNSSNRLKYNYAYEHNEDWQDINAVAERFGISYDAPNVQGARAISGLSHPLVEESGLLDLVENNGVGFTVEHGETLATMSGRSVMSLVEFGAGEVLVLADLGILGSPRGEPANLQFWRDLATYARSR